ncbi:metallophosphoesterase [Anseongella ginsenosidimutans]|nr:metallophosphoesterase [Anseongella ginsenosidimutans]
MTSTFQNPRNPLAAMWASAAESHLREQNPNLSIQQIRQLPMMQGVYAHLNQLKQRQRVIKPPAQGAASETSHALKVAQMAYLSQVFFDFAMTTAAFYNSGNALYLDYLTKVIEDYNNSHDIDDFSTEDLWGFGLCLIVWVGLVGLTDINPVQLELLNYIINQLPIPPELKQDINEFWSSIPKDRYSIQYRNAADYPGYQIISWKIPSDAQIIMLGDWGTSLEDAHEFLYAIWKKAYQNNPGKAIVFIHLGDIYYCGLPYECQEYFYNVFVNVGQRLREDIGNDNFNPNPPIFTIPGNHEYYSYGYGYFQLLDTLNQNVPGVNPSALDQECSFFCLQTEDQKWQFLGMDTGRTEGNALLDLLQLAGDIVKEWIDEHRPDWSWVHWITDLAKATYDDYVGPFQPTLDPNELNWLEDKLVHFHGKTIMLSHHQLFSREAEINHNSPEYMNTWLDKHFSSYYKDKIAAWYWGHEHTFAVYLDGLMGLNKGRLLGSSSYEATEDSDTPYANNYPAVPFSPNMTDTLVHKNNDGLYYHTGAIMHQSGSDMAVKYYQFPAWSQLGPRPDTPKLEEIGAVAENITTSFKSLKPTWIGDVPISQDEVTTEHSPSVATWNDVLYMLYADGSDSPKLKVCTANAADFQPEKKGSVLHWSHPSKIGVNNSTISTKNSPVVIAVNGQLYGFYIDSNKYLQGITAEAGTSIPDNWNWASIGNLPGQVGDAAPAACFFQGRIYIVYRQSGSDNNLCWAYYDPEARSWHNFGPLNNTGGNNFESPNAPALAADAYHIYLAYQVKDGTDIRWAVGTPSNAAPGGSSDNISWADKGKLETAGKQETTNPDTEIGMTLQYADGIFLLVYTSTNYSLTQCALNDTGADSTGSWVGSNTVKANVNTNPSTVRSGRVPALAITAGGGFLVYRGKDHDEIYWAYY